MIRDIVTTRKTIQNLHCGRTQLQPAAHLESLVHVSAAFLHRSDNIHQARAMGKEVINQLQQLRFEQAAGSKEVDYSYEGISSCRHSDLVLLCTGPMS
jgi:hypothetical protein